MIDDPPGTAAAPSNSRESAEGAGWRLEPGTFLERWRAAGGRGHLSWRGVRTLWSARNEVIAKAFGDPTDAQRRAWMASLAEQRALPENLIVIPRARGIDGFRSFVLVGDTGEGDQSQWASVPALERQTASCDFMLIVSDVIYPAGHANQYPQKLSLPYANVDAPIYAIPGNHDWDDGTLQGFMLNFCGQETVPA